MAFVDLERAFNHVLRHVILWALRKLGIEKWLLRLIQSLYENAECMLVVAWVKSSVWKWVFIKVLAWVPYCSSRFWNPSSKSFIQNVPGKTYMQMTWPSSLNHWRNCNRNGSSCSKTCFVDLVIRSIFWGKNCTCASALIQFFPGKSNELTDQQDMFCFNHACTSYTSNDIKKNVD